jgi:hypothetical protein
MTLSPARNRNWVDFMATTIEVTINAGEIVAGTDTEQLAFELIALLEAANAASVLHQDPQVCRRASVAILHRLRAVAADESLLPTTP